MFPNQGEVSPLYEKKEGENTLDYWAGYSLNPDDVVRLQKKLTELPRNRATCSNRLEVSEARGKENEEMIFDLGGNVAEWVVASGRQRPVNRRQRGSTNRPTRLAPTRPRLRRLACGSRRRQAKIKTMAIPDRR